MSFIPNQNPQQENPTLSLLTQFPFHSITNQTTLHHCDTFTLSQALYNNEPIFLISFSFFDQSTLTSPDNHSKFTTIISKTQNNNPSTHTLTLLNIYLNQTTNTLYLIYSNPNNDLSLFINNSCLFLQKDISFLSLHSLSTQLIMLIEQTTLNIANIIKQIHEQQNKAINLLHPYLIFQSKQTNELYICDSTFYEMHFCFNKTLNFPICPYFGIFDIDLFINHSDNNDYYQKCDVYLLCAMLVYFTRNGNDYFSSIINELNDSFYNKDKSFTSIYNSISNYESVYTILQHILSLSYDKVQDIDALCELLKQQLVQIECTCSNCHNKYDQHIKSLDKYAQCKLICTNCSSLKCMQCEENEQHKHKCDNNDILLKVKAFQQKQMYDNIIYTYKSIPEMKGKYMIESFSNFMNVILNDFKNMNDVVKRRISQEEHFINTINVYIRDLLEEYAINKYNEIKKTIQEIKMDENKQTYFNPMTTSTKSIPKIINENDSSYISDNNPNSNIENNVLVDKINKLSQSIEDFQTFTKDASELISSIIYDFSIEELFDLLHGKYTNLTSLIKDKFVSVYKTSMDELIQRSYNEYTKAFPITNDNLLNEYITRNEINDRVFGIYMMEPNVFNIVAYTPEHLNNDENIFQVVLDNNNEIQFDNSYRTLNMKTGMVLSKDENFYFINYEPNAKTNTNSITKMPNMLTKHEHHAMILYNVYNVIVIGGIKSNKCEMFNFGNMKWMGLPQLNNVRSHHCSFIINDKVVYVFCGVDERGKGCCDIEMLNLSELYTSNIKWNSVMISNYNNNNEGKVIKCATVKKVESYINNNELIICGGINNKNEFYNYCHVLNLNDNTLNENKEMKCNEYLHLESNMLLSNLTNNSYYEQL